MTDKYILDGHTPIPVDDVLTWAKWYETGNRRVAQTRIEDTYNVSTVFLGLDHRYGEGAPILFETMIFSENEKFGDYQERYSTWEEAEAGHKKACEFVTNSL